MSYRINEAISDYNKRLEVLRDLQEKYPDAYQDKIADQLVWVSPSLKKEQCNSVYLIQVAPFFRDESPIPALLLCREEEHYRVFPEPISRVVLGDYLFNKMSEKDPELLGLLIEHVKKFGTSY